MSDRRSWARRSTRSQSIALLGQLTPVSVRPDNEKGGYVLIAGHKRYVALAQLGHTEVRAEIRPGGETEASERAAENIVRSSLNPYEEAIAVKAMLDRGLTEDGAAQALGWPQQHSPMRWSSHKDHARKALAKLAGPHLPVTLKQVEIAVAKAPSEHQKAASGRTTTSRAAGGDGEEPVAEPADADALDDELDVDQRRDENLDDQVADVDLEVREVPM